MKLELKHLAPYLPYRLKFLDKYEQKQGKKILTGTCGLYIYYNDYEKNWTSLDYVVPALRPITDLYNTDGFSLSNMISHGYHNSFWSKENFSVNHLYYHDLIILLEWHFDVFGLIDAGLAIDINTLNHEKH